MPAAGSVMTLRTVMAVIVGNIGLAQGCGPGADRAVDVKVTGESPGAHPSGKRPGRLLVADELGPVADDLRAVTAPPGREDVGEVGFRAERGATVLVHQPDTGRSRSVQGGIDVGAAVGSTDPGVERVAGRMVRLTGHQPVLVPARVSSGTGGGRQRRGDHSRVAVHPW